MLIRFGIVFAIFCFAMHFCHAASNEHLRGKDCKAEANFALMLFQDKEKGAIVNVMPKDQDTLDMVMAHKGTREELWWKVYGSCNGQET